MDTVGTVAAVTVGVIFIVSGGLKLVGRDDWMRQSADLGVSDRLARVVPWYEALLGALMLSGLFRPWPAMAATLTLMVFTWFLVRRMLDGTRPPCACFGSRSTRPLGSRHLIRNGALILIAALGIFAA